MSDTKKGINNTAVIRKTVDVLMCILLMLLMGYQVTGQALHEWIGMGMTLTWIVHHVLNRKWYGALTKGRYNAYRVVSTVVNSLLLISIILTAFCGMSMSGHAVPFLYGLAKVSFVRPMHLAMSHWSFVLMGIHLGLHVTVMMAGLKINDRTRHLITGVMTVVSGYGLYLFLKSGMPGYLLFRSKFAMLDYDKPGTLVILENVLMMLFWVFAGAQTFNICKALSVKKKKGERMKYETKEQFEKVNIFGTGASNDAYAQFFIGESYLNPLTDFQNGELPLFNVTFEPGCRNNWHIHHAKSGGGQILICNAGEGWYQEEGKEVQELLPGTVVVIPPEVKHWHGAKKDTWFSHIAVEVPGEDTSNEWCEPVSDEDYSKLG